MQLLKGDPESKKGKKKKSRGKGKGADDKDGEVPEQLGAPQSYPPSTYNAWAYSPYYMQPYGKYPAVAQGYPAPPSVLPPQQASDTESFLH